MSHHEDIFFRESRCWTTYCIYSWWQMNLGAAVQTFQQLNISRLALSTFNASLKLIKLDSLCFTVHQFFSWLHHNEFRGSDSGKPKWNGHSFIVYRVNWSFLAFHSPRYSLLIHMCQNGQQVPAQGEKDVAGEWQGICSQSAGWHIFHGSDPCVSGLGIWAHTLARI